VTVLAVSTCQVRCEFSARSLSNIGIYQGLFESNVSIVQPILGIPARLEPGDDLEIRVVLHADVEGDWFATISRFGRVMTLTLLDTFPSDRSWLLRASISPDAAPGLYDLTVGKGVIMDLERHAVSIGYDHDRLTLVHVTDVHVDRPEPDGLGTIMHTVEVINLVRPDLVVVTGDFQDPGQAQQMKEFATRFLLNLDVPAYITPGNHEFKDDPQSYYTYLNPYPDYAFDFGPARFISLNQYQTYPFFIDQIAFLDAEVSRPRSGPTIILLHDPYSFRSYARGNFTLMLAGHTHQNDAVDIRLSLELGYSVMPNAIPDGPLLLVTETARRAIRIITFRQRIVACSYDPSKLKTPVPVAGVSIDVSPRDGTSNYQRLDVKNELQMTIRNTSWTFNLSNPGNGWTAAMLGAELEEEGSFGQHSLYRARFDLPSMSLTTVECVNIVPTDEESREILSQMIGQGMQSLDAVCSILRDHGVDPGAIEQSLREGFAAARLACEAANWTWAAVEFSRSDWARGLLADLAAGLKEAAAKLVQKEVGGLMVGPVRAWLGEAMEAIESGDCKSADVCLHRILALGEEEWLLADAIARAGVALALAQASGQDVTGPEGELQGVFELFHRGEYVLSRDGLRRIYAAWPQLFAAPEPTGSNFVAVLLSFACFVGMRGAFCGGRCRRLVSSWAVPAGNGRSR